MTELDLAVQVVDLIHAEPQRQSQQGRAAITRGRDIREICVVHMLIVATSGWAHSVIM